MSTPTSTGADGLSIGVQWDDRTVGGSPLTPRLPSFVYNELYPLTTRHLLEATRRRNKSLVDIAEINALVRRDRSRESYVNDLNNILYPDERAVAPVRVTLENVEAGSRLCIPLGTLRATDVGAALRGERRDLSALSTMLSELPTRRRAPLGVEPLEPLFIGHACVSWSSGRTRIWTDPFFRPKSPRYAPRYQPLSPLDFPEMDHIVLLTHSHPDHFDPASVLLFPEKTRFVVPCIPRESALSTNVALRLRQLGFEHVVDMDWWTSSQLDDFVVTALPFYGEQPLGWGSAHELSEYNRGNTYAIRDRRERTSVVLADSGSDPRRSIIEHAHHLRREIGKVDFLFANHRRWQLYPAQHLLTSVPQYLCYVPDAELGVQQKIMMTPEELASVAEIVGARYVVPYAMGGGYWHEEIGLGFDYLSRRKSTSFDSDPRDLSAIEDVQGGIKLKKPFRPIVLIPGAIIGAREEPRLACGLKRPTRQRCKPIAQPAPDARRYVAIDAPPRELLHELSQLVPLDPHAFFIASDELCEVYTSPGNAGTLLRDILEKQYANATLAWHSRPRTAQPFSEDKALFLHFLAMHHELFASMQRGTMTTTARSIVRHKLFSSLPGDLIDRVRVGLLGHASPHTRILPLASLTRKLGRKRVLRGLLLVKLLHNLYVTASTLGVLEKAGIGTEESDWHDTVLRRARK